MGERAPKREVRINWHIGSAVAAAQLHPPLQDFPDLDFRRRRWIIKPLRFESSVRFAATASRATQRKRKHRIALIVSMATGTPFVKPRVEIGWQPLQWRLHTWLYLFYLLENEKALVPRVL